MAKPIAGAAANGSLTSAEPAILINLITIMELNKPINNDPVSPIKIFAGEKL